MESQKEEENGKKTRRSNDNNEERAVYQINCKDCAKIYIGETKFKIGKRIGQQKKYIQFSRENSAVVRHSLELGHQIDWEVITYLEKEKIKIPRKIIEGCHIRGNRNRCMNLNDGLNISAQYEEGEVAWVCRGRENKEKVTKLSKAESQYNLNDGRD